MIGSNNLFVIYTAAGEVRLMGSASSMDFIMANSHEGDTVHWGDNVAKSAHGIVSGEEIEFNIV